MNKKKRDKSRHFVNKTKPKALFLRHTIKLHIFAKDTNLRDFFIHLKNIKTYGN